MFVISMFVISMFVISMFVISRAGFKELKREKHFTHSLYYSSTCNIPLGATLYRNHQEIVLLDVCILSC